MRVKAIGITLSSEIVPIGLKTVQVRVFFEQQLLRTCQRRIAFRRIRGICGWIVRRIPPMSDGDRPLFCRE